MPYVALRSSRCPRQDRRRRRNRALLAVAVGTLALAGFQLAGTGGRGPAQPVSVAALPVAAPVRPVVADYAWMLDPSPALGATQSGLSPAEPLASDFQRAVAPSPVEARIAAVALPVEAAEPPVMPMAEAAAIESPRPAQVGRLASAVPLVVSSATPMPVPRPPEFRRAAIAMTARPARDPAMASTQSVFRAARAEEPSLMERIFGDAPAEPALGYAALEGGSKDIPSRQRLIPAPAPMSAAGTAIYDITAQRVTLPSGEVLEAHSGLGASMDNPNHVHLTMRGSTPPGTYDLKEREALFHGVRAIRLNPVGGPAAVKNRVGLLAHTYMLGPSGASNGCVSFRDYNRFLQAYLRGEIQRLVVVAGNAGDGPSWGGRLFGTSGRAAIRTAGR